MSNIKLLEGRKTCCRCKAERPLADFYVDAGKHRGACRFCYAARQKERSRAELNGRFPVSDILLSPDDEDLRTWKTYRYMNGYVMANTTPAVMLHRLVAERIIGRKIKRGECVDHLNRNKADNRRENLRVVPRALNQHNVSGAHRDKKTPGSRGVTPTPYGRWQVLTTRRINGKDTPQYLGVYATMEEASAAFERYRSTLPGYVPTETR